MGKGGVARTMLGAPSSATKVRLVGLRSRLPPPEHGVGDWHDPGGADDGHHRPYPLWASDLVWWPTLEVGRPGSHAVMPTRIWRSWCCITSSLGNGPALGPAGPRAAAGGLRRWPASHQPGVWGVRDRPWPAVLAVSGRATHLVRRRSQRRRRPTALAVQPAAATSRSTSAHPPQRLTSPTNRNADLRKPQGGRHRRPASADPSCALRPGRSAGGRRRCRSPAARAGCRQRHGLGSPRSPPARQTCRSHRTLPGRSWPSRTAARD